MLGLLIAEPLEPDAELPEPNAELPEPGCKKT